MWWKGRTELFLNCRNMQCPLISLVKRLGSRGGARCRRTLTTLIAEQWFWHNVLKPLDATPIPS